MKRAIKRAAVCALVFAMCILCGCSPFNFDTDELLAAPKLTGELQTVYEALEKGIPQKHSLKFPLQGDYRSAVNMIDLDNDNESEAVAFYSTKVDNTVTLHISIVDKTEKGWAVTAEQKLVAGSIERVVFQDMNGDGVKEIIVGWNIYGMIDRQVNIYQYTNNTLLTLLEEPYTSFVICDLNADLSNDILLLNLNLSKGTSLARYYGISSSGVHELGYADMDGGVTHYYDPIISRTAEGDTFVFVDSIKGAGTQTEVLYFDEGVLKNPLYNIETKETPITARASTVVCQDFDGDGVVEIPVMIAFPLGEALTTNEKAYVTIWSKFDKGGLKPELYTLMNYPDGYYVTLTKEQYDNISVSRNTENRERVVYRYDYENETFHEELYRIRTVSKTIYNAGVYESTGYVLLNETDTVVYLGLVTAEGQAFGFSEEQLKASFSLIRKE